MKNEYQYTILRDPNTGFMYENGPVTINESSDIVAQDTFRTHLIKDYYDKDYSHPLLSEFIQDLTRILETYGDGYLSTNNEMTPELFGKITVREKTITGLPSANGENVFIRYFDIDEMIR